MAAVLDEGSIGKFQKRRPFLDPGLQRLVACQLVEVVALAAERDPPPDAFSVAQGPEHRHLVVAEQDFGVRAVAGVTERADTEHAVVDEVANEEGSPLVGGVGFEGLEEAL